MPHPRQHHLPRHYERGNRIQPLLLNGIKSKNGQSYRHDFLVVERIRPRRPLGTVNNSNDVNLIGFYVINDAIRTLKNFPDLLKSCLGHHTTHEGKSADRVTLLGDPIDRSLGVER